MSAEASSSILFGPHEPLKRFWPRGSRRLLSVLLFLQVAVMARAALAEEDVPVVAPLATRAQHRYVHRVALDPTGEILASSFFETTWLCEATTGKPLPGPEAPPRSLAPMISKPVFSADGKIMVSNGRDGRIEFWSLERRTTTRVIIEPWLIGERTGTPGRFEMRLLRPIVEFGKVALSGNGKVLAAATVDATVQLWDAQTGRYLGEVGKRFSKRNDIELRQIVGIDIDDEAVAERFPKTSPDGSGVTRPTAFQLWEIPERVMPVVGFIGLDQLGTSVIYQAGTVVRCCDIATRNDWMKIENCTEAAMSADGSTLLCWIELSKKMIVVDVTKRVRTSEFGAKWAGQRVIDFTVLPDLRHLMVRCAGATVRAVRLADGAVLAQYQCDDHGDVLDDWSVSAHGNRMAVHWRDLGTRIWNIDFGAAGRR